MKYRDGLEPALTDLSFKVEKGMKVGIVGRTGSGKSSILEILFRLVEVTKGRVEIDGVNITDIGLQVLRSAIAFIP
jgi:ATP-binding cassette subfamily C (CFTR/MRP) protein 1